MVTRDDIENFDIMIEAVVLYFFGSSFNNMATFNRGKFRSSIFINRDRIIMRDFDFKTVEAFTENVMFIVDKLGTFNEITDTHFSEHGLRIRGYDIVVEKRVISKDFVRVVT